MNRRWLAASMVLIVLIPLGALVAASGELRRAIATAVGDFVTRAEVKEAKTQPTDLERRRQRRDKRYDEARRQAEERGVTPEFVKTGPAKSSRTRITWLRSGEQRLYPSPFERLEGISRPPILTSTDLGDGKRIKDSAPIIGVRIGGKSRAYLIQAFSESGYEIVNDNIGGYLVTVTYDYRNRRGRVFVPPDQKEPLPLDQHIDVYQCGSAENTLLVGFGDREYWQDSPDVPLKDHSFKITSWYSWQLLYPRSEAYIGPELVK